MKHLSYLSRPSYRPKRVLAVSKLSALEFLKRQHPDVSENKILARMKNQGKDPQEILNEHRLQIACEKNLANVLKKLDIRFRITKRIGDASKCVEWADLVIPIGGDGTFLLASKLVKDNAKPVLGINPNVDNRDNSFTLPLKYTRDIEMIFKKLYAGEYSVLMRSRIRTIMNGEGLYGRPFHVHEKSRTQGEKRVEALIRSTQRKIADGLQPRERILPWLALNEVFMGEFWAVRAIRLNVQVDDNEQYAIKSSGICVCTGSGSRSWYKSMNFQSADAVRKIVAIATGREPSMEKIKELLRRYHANLIFPPEDLRMTCMIREMYRTSRYFKSKRSPEKQMCRRVRVKSGGFDAGLVLDGSVSLPFNDGTTAVFDIKPEHALRHIILK